MLKSMTGFGRTEQSIGKKTFLIDIKSLNGKQFDLQLKMPSLLKPYEFEIRKYLSERLIRGTVECLINLKDTGDAKPITINKTLAREYYKPLAELAEELHLQPGDILNTLLKLPEVITPSSDTLSSDEWEAFKNLLQAAIDDLNAHRIAEGAVLRQDLITRIENIVKEKTNVADADQGRKEKIKQGLKKQLEDNVGKENYDPNRLEQELVFYIEKLDISEELIRLENHCDYFLNILDGADDTKGKKLSFILQEIGREINTTGSKAYDASIQKRVVQMKDELEKAKEQILNVM